jgi:hypothetical protein
MAGSAGVSATAFRSPFEDPNLNTGMNTAAIQGQGQGQQPGGGGGTPPAATGSYPGFGGGPSLPPPSSLVAQSQNYSPVNAAGSYGSGFVGPSTPGLTQGGYEKQQQTQLESDLGAKNRAAAIAAFNAQMGASTAGGPAGPSQAEVDAATAAEYGKAKDKIGLNRLAAVKSFENRMAGKGLQNSTIAGSGIGNIIAGAGGELGDVALDQAQDVVANKRFLENRGVQINEARRADTMRALSSILGSGSFIY